MYQNFRVKLASLVIKKTMKNNYKLENSDHAFLKQVQCNCFSTQLSYIFIIW